MTRPSATALCAFALLAAAPAVAKPKVAVLEVVSPDVTREQAAFVSDVIRREALRALGDEYDIITRENLVVLLANTGKSLADCEGECDVETGRRIGADLVVGGRLVRFGQAFNLILALHSTGDAVLLASAQANAAGSLEGIPPAVAEACRELFAPLRPKAGKPSAAAPAPKPVRPPPQPPFRLAVSSDPPGASVRLDEEPLGETPLVREVAPGKRKLTLELRGRWPERRELAAVSGDKVELVVPLRPAPVPGWTWATGGAGLAAAALAAGALVLGQRTFADYEDQLRLKGVKDDGLVGRANLYVGSAAALGGLAALAFALTAAGVLAPERFGTPPPP